MVEKLVCSLTDWRVVMTTQDVYLFIKVQHGGLDRAEKFPAKPALPGGRESAWRLEVLPRPPGEGEADSSPGKLGQHGQPQAG